MNKVEAVPGDPAAFQLERFLPYRLSLLTNTVSSGLARHYRDLHGVSVTEWRILAVLGRFEGLTASEVAARTAMDKVAISRAVKTLIAKGLLRRKTDAEDRRRRRLFITPIKGEQLLSDIVPLAQQYEKQLLDLFSEAELKAFSSALDGLQEQARILNENQ